MADKTILIVESDKLFAESECKWLENAGYKTKHVLNGKDAIKIVDSGKNEIDLILWDIIADGQIDSIYAVQEILTKHDFPILFVTSSSEKEIIEKTSSIFSYGYIQKNVDESVFVASVKTALLLHDRNKKQIIKERNLLLTEEKFSKAFYNSLDIVSINRLSDGTYLDVNNGFVKILGYTPEEVIGHTPLADDLKIYYNDFDSGQVSNVLKEYGEYSDFETSFRCKDGSIKITLMSASVIELNGEKCVISIARDITDRKRINRFLEDRISTLTGSHEDTSDIRFEDLFDLKEIQKIQDAFAEATGVASIITNVDGVPFTRPSNFCNLCENIIRKTEKGLANCYHSDAIVGKQNPSGPIMQSCLSGGLWDGGASISVGDRHIANWLIGQILDESIDQEKMIEYGKVIGANEEEFRNALKNVTRMSKEKFDKICNALFLIAGQLSRLALQNVQQARHIAERRKTESALKRSEEKYRNLIELAPDATFQGYENGDLINVNEQALKLTGYSKKELLNINIRNLFPKEVLEEKPIRYDLLKDGRIVKNERELVKKDGSRIIIEMTSKQMPDETIQSFLRDVTENKKAEEFLRKSEENYRSLIEFAADAFFQGNSSGNLLSVNDEAVIMTGYSKEELRKMKMSELFPPEVLNEKPLRYDLLNTESVLKTERELVRKDGKRVFVEMKSKKMPDGTFQSFFRDITERRQIENALRNLSQLQSLILNNSTVGITLVKNRAFEWVNERMTELFGYSMEQFQSASTEILYANKEVYEKIGDEAYPFIYRGERSEHELELRKSDGTLFWCHFEGKAVNLAKPEEGVIWIIEDISKRKQAEESLKEISRLQSLILDNSTVGIAFIRNMVYEWVNPRMEELFGYSMDEIKMNPSKMLFVKEDFSEEMVNRLYRVLSQGKRVEFETQMKRKDGSLFWCKLEGKALDHNVPEEGSIWIFEDITERKKSEEEIQKIYQLQSLILNNSTVGITLIKNRVFEWVNIRMTELFGYNMEQFQNASTEIIYPSKKAYEKLGANAYPSIFKGERSEHELELRKRDGTLFWCHFEGKAVNFEKPEDGVIWIVEDITKRKQAEETFKKINEQQSLILNNSTVGISFVRNRIQEWVNPRMGELFGYSADELKMMPTRAFYKDEDSYNKVGTEVYSCFAQKKKAEIEIQMIKKDGSLFWCHLEGKAFNPKKPHDGTIWIFEDITDRKRSEEEIQKISKLQTLILDNSTVGISLIRNRTFVWVNPRIVELLGYSSNEELNDQSTRIIFNSEEVYNIFGVDAYVPLEKGEKSEIEVQMQRKDGTLFLCRLVGKAIDPSKPHDGSIWMWEDITERKRIEEEMIRISKLQSLILDNSTIGIAFVRNRIFEWVNPRMLDLFDLPIEVLQGASTRIIYPDEKAYEQFGRESYEILSEGKKATQEIELKRGDGTLFWCRYEGKALDPVHPQEGSIWIWEDITERRRFLSELQESEETFRKLFEDSADPILLLREGRFYACNQATLKLLKITDKNQLINLTPTEISPEYQPDGRLSSKATTDFIETAYRNGSTRFEWTCFKSDGTDLLLEVTLIPIILRGEKLLHVFWRDITESKRIENALKESEEKFRSIYSQSPIAIELYNCEGELIDVNNTCLEIFGIKDISAIKSFNLFQDPNLSEQIIADLKKKIPVRKEILFDFDIVKKNNLYKTSRTGKCYLDLLITPVESDNRKQSVSYLIQIRDVTERKKAEEELHNAIIGLEIAQERAHLGNWDLDIEKQVGKWSKEMFRLHGLEPALQPPSYSDFFNLIHPDDCQSTRDFHKRAMETGLPVNFEYRTKPENKPIKILNVTFYPASDESGKIKYAYGTCLDITERKLAEEALQEMNEIFRLFMKYNPVYVFIKDENIRSIYLSDNYEKMLNRPISELLGKSMDELFPSEISKKIIEDDKRILSEGKPYEVLEEFNGRIYSTLKFPILIKGIPKYLAGYTSDITEKKQVEIQLQKYTENLKELNSSKDKFFSILSHDLRNPFYSINSSISLILSDDSLTAEDKNQLLRGVLNTSEKAYSLLENVLLWSKNQMGKTEFITGKVDLTKEIQQNIELMKNAASLKNIKLNNKIEKGLFVYVDQNMLNLVLRNLIANAIKFTRENGKVEIKSKTYNNTVELCIIDNGVGIDKTYLENLFKIEQSYTTKGTNGESGSGLGLIICKEFVEKNKGKIWAESEIGRGTEIYFTLPRYLESD
jgi:PAS domain S-box-containing protein